MPEDASLDAFAAAGEDGAETESDEPRAEPEADADAPGATPGTERTAGDDSPDPDPEPSMSTYAWSPDGGECAACGASVERRWRDGERLVCPDCKEW